MFKPITNENREMANGQRNRELSPLTDQEIAFVKREIQRIDALKDIDIFIFNDPDHVKDPQTTKNASPQQSPLSASLAKKALREQRQNGTVTVKCPKCGQMLKIITDENRTIVRCNCKYIFDDFIRL